MTAQLRLTVAADITDMSTLRIGREDHKVKSLYVTPSGARVVQLPGQPVRVFLPHDYVTLVDPTGGGAA